MLRQRILTALVLIPLVVGMDVYLGTEWLALAFGVLALLGAWEWVALAGYTSTTTRIGYQVVVASLLGVFWFLFPAQWGDPLLLGIAMVWIGMALWLFVYSPRIRPLVGPAPLLLLAGLFVLGGGWIGLVELHRRPMGVELTLVLFLLVWGADSAAYFSGKRWGRYKLSPGISPGKTLEGLGGALVFGLLAGVLLSLYWGWSMPLLVLLSLVTVVLSVVGDLLESYLKRNAGVKDSGSLLPGHGGVLDRIDSLTAAAPVFAAGISLWGLSP